MALALAAAVALVGGCAMQPPPPSSGLVFELRGRFSVTQAREANSGNFLWRQYPGGFEVDLWGPLGQGRARLIGQGTSLTLVNARGETVADGDAEALMQRELGWSAPLSALSSWLVGQPAPGLPARTNGDAFEQLGWQVQVTAWAQVGERRLPRRLEAQRGGLRIVVACREWSAPPI